MPEPRPALAGVRVVDLTTVVFGPLATQTLADYGAEVIKIEAPGGDSTRHTGPALEPGLSTIFLGANRNKRSVVLDLKLEAARAALLALLDTADVFIHNVRPQKLARLGLGPEALCARCPRLVYVGLHGFGEGGPYAGQPAYDDIIQSLSGAADLMQHQAGEPRFLPTIAADKVCSHMAVHAVMAALLQRAHSGRGQVVEVPMFESMVSFLLAEHLYAGHLRPGGEMGYPRSLGEARKPYRTADGHACLMPYSNEHWARFFAAVGAPEHAADPRFASIGQRTQHVAELHRTVAAFVVQRPSAYWLDLCRELDIPCAPVRALQDLDTDPHLQAVGLFQPVADPGPAPGGAGAGGAGAGAAGPGTGRVYRFTRQPVRLADTRVPLRMPPRLGEHTQQVLDSLPLAPAQRQALGLDTGRSPPVEATSPGPDPNLEPGP